MNFQHKILASGKWNELPLIDQMANVGSEVDRAMKWREKGKNEISMRAFYRALELLSLCKSDSKNKDRLKELCRGYELLVDYFAGDNIYHSTDEQWRKYFYGFNYLARKGV